jgi:zinc finger SWIM domain-containing protein 3
MKQLIIRFTLKCGGSAQCAFEIKGIEQGSHFEIVVCVLDHSCPDDLIVNTAGNRLDWVVYRLRRSKLALQQLTPRGVCDYFINTYDAVITYQTAFRALNELNAGGTVDGALDLDLIPSFCDTIVSQGGHAELCRSPGGKFSRVFVAEGAMIQTFPRLLPVISMDGTHLKSSLKGVLLLAVAPDANNNLAILAYAIVGSENLESWRWFVRHMHVCFPGMALPEHVVISDRQKGLERALDELMPTVYHAACLRHLRANVAGKFGKGAGDLVWKIGSAYYPENYLLLMEQLYDLSPEAHEYVLDSCPERWANSLFPVPRYTRSTSNNVETINGVLKQHRSMGHFDLLLGIHNYSMDKEAQWHYGPSLKSSHFVAIKSHRQTGSTYK